MDISSYEKYKKSGRAIFIGGIFMCYETIKYSTHIGIIMIIFGIIIMIYYQKKIDYINNINNIMIRFNNKIIKFLEENSRPVEIKEKEKEMFIIRKFEKKYNLINNNIINNNINNDLVDMYLFVSKLKIVIDLKLINNKLLLEYYNYYYNIVSYISNLDNPSEISIAIYDLNDDYNDNSKNLYKLFNLDSNKNRHVNNISDMLTNKIHQNLDNTFKKN